MTTVNVDALRHDLTRWIVEAHVPFNVVEHPRFQQLLMTVNPSVEGYLVRSGNTIRNWIEDDFL